jgi:hypothetical protein
MLSEKCLDGSDSYWQILYVGLISLATARDYIEKREPKSRNLDSGSENWLWEF